MPRFDGSPQSGWQPPRWLFSVIAILVVAWWVSTQPPPQGERPAAPAPERNTHFEPPMEIVPGTSAERDDASIPAKPEKSTSTLPEVVPEPSSTNPTVTAPITPPQSKTEAKKSANDRLIVKNITIKDQSGRVAFKGDVDLHPTFDRIERGEKFPHRNDGSPFRNLERRLPQKPAGYYTEYVHPTPGMNGPGPQRVVIGKDGEAFYTHDHYNSFRKVRG